MKVIKGFLVESIEVLKSILVFSCSILLCLSVFDSVVSIVVDTWLYSGLMRPFILTMLICCIWSLGKIMKDKMIRILFSSNDSILIDRTKLVVQLLERDSELFKEKISRYGSAIKFSKSSKNIDRYTDKKINYCLQYGEEKELFHYCKLDNHFSVEDRKDEQRAIRRHNSIVSECSMQYESLEFIPIENEKYKIMNY